MLPRPEPGSAKGSSARTDTRSGTGCRDAACEGCPGTGQAGLSLDSKYFFAECIWVIEMVLSSLDLGLGFGHRRCCSQCSSAYGKTTSSFTLSQAGPVKFGLPVTAVILV